MLELTAQILLSLIVIGLSILVMIEMYKSRKYPAATSETITLTIGLLVSIPTAVYLLWVSVQQIINL